MGRRDQQLPKRVSNKNFETCIVIDIGAARKHRDSEGKRDARRPRVLELLDLAEQFRDALATGAVNSRADLARLQGTSPARVTQIMALLRLHPDLVRFVRATPGLGVPTPSERRLRPLTGLSRDGQLVMAEPFLAGIRDFLGAIRRDARHTG